MENLIMYILSFIFIYFFYIIFVLNRPSILKKLPQGKELTYLKKRYGIKITDKNIKRIASKVFFANSFILSTTLYVVVLIENLFIKIIVAIPVLILLILILYHIIGTYYNKKQGGKYV